jgi:hypothetical protein
MIKSWESIPGFLGIPILDTDTLNRLCLETLFADKTPLHAEVVPGDYDANPENYVKGEYGAKKKPIVVHFRGRAQRWYP